MNEMSKCFALWDTGFHALLYTALYFLMSNEGYLIDVVNHELKLILSFFGSNERSPSLTACGEVNTVTGRMGCISDESSSFRPISS